MKNKSILPFLLLFFKTIIHSDAQQLSDSNLPIIDINTNNQNIPDDPKITAKMRFIFNENGVTRVSDPANLYDGLIGIETRGSTSQGLSPKKPYSIELRDDLGNDKPIGFFGWTKMEDWALIAPYSDKTLMRDALTYYLAGSFMSYAPKTRFCELVLNGQYQGVYVLTENIKRKRLGISKTEPTTTTGDELTGGYIIKIDKTTGEIGGYSLGFSSQYPNSNGRYTSFIYDYPEPQNINAEQSNYIKTLVREFETVLKSDKYASDTEGYAKYFDVQSLIDFLIINEVTRNVDGYRLSTYFHKDRNSINPKFKMGPVWDFNIALGNANYCEGGSIYGWAYQFNTVCPSDGWGVPFWWERFMSDNKFKKQLKSRWFQLRENQLNTNRIYTVIDSFKNVLSSAQDRNFKKWNILNTYVWPNSQVKGTYNAEVDYLKTWLTQRLIWLDAQFDALKTADSVIKEGILEVAPNPAQSNGDIRFAYSLSRAYNVKLKIFNAAGQLISTQNALQNVGDNNLNWGKTAQKGIYFYQLYLDYAFWKAGKVVKM